MSSESKERVKGVDSILAKVDTMKALLTHR